MAARKKRLTLKERRTEKRAAIEAARDELEADVASTKEDMSQTDLLKSVTDGLYEELDKLSKKAPVDEATDLVVDHVNTVIEDVRALAPNDVYVQRVNPFVPAGDNPEHRDVILVLKQLRQGLDRCADRLERREKTLANRISLALGLIVALAFYIERSKTQITVEDLEANGVSLPSKEWWETLAGSYGEKWVALARIDAFNVDSLVIDAE